MRSKILIALLTTMFPSTSALAISPPCESGYRRVQTIETLAVTAKGELTIRSIHVYTSRQPLRDKKTPKIYRYDQNDPFRAMELLTTVNSSPDMDVTMAIITE